MYFFSSMKHLASLQHSSHDGVTTGIPIAIASSMFLVRANFSATKCVASEIVVATGSPKYINICQHPKKRWDSSTDH
jgi:hypothetical protein